MAGAPPSELLRDAVIYLAAAAVAVPLFQRLRLGAVLGYLAAGIAIGPQGLGLIGEVESVMRFAEFGIVLLLFVIGLELKPARLWDLRRDIFGLGLLQLTLCGLALTAALMALTSLSWQAALVVGLPLALSSTALVVQLLQEQGELNTPQGERAFSILLFQDIAIVPLLIIVAALSRVADPSAPGGVELVLYSVAAIIGLVLAGRFILNPAFRLIAHIGAREVFVIAALLTVLGAALLMASFGLSMALGAFIAGVMLADSPYRHEVEADIEPFRGLLLGLFFISVGMGLNIALALQEPLRVVGLVLLLMTVKTAIIAALARLFGTPWAKAWPLGLLLSQGGEFAFVLLAAAVSGLLITAGAASLFGVVVTLSMAFTLLIMALWRGLPKPTRTEPEPQGLLGPGPEQGTAIVVGYGRFGQIVTQLLHARGVDVVLIDRKQSQIERSASFGWRVYYGDGLRPDVLRAAGAETAKVLLITFGGKAWDPARLEPIRAAFPDLPVIVRAYDRQHAMHLHAAGEKRVVRELFGSALHAGRLALAELGVAPETAAAIEAEYVRRDRERLQEQAVSGDIRAGMDKVFRPGGRWRPDDPHEPHHPDAQPPAEEAGHRPAS